MSVKDTPPGTGEIRILLLPFCLGKNEFEDISTIAEDRGYSVIVATSTAYALSEVRRIARTQREFPVRIVGVVCDGRAKKVALGLFLLKARQFMKRTVARKARKIVLSRVSINGGTQSMFGRRRCDIGNNTVARGDLLDALEGRKIFFIL